LWRPVLRQLGRLHEALADQTAAIARSPFDGVFLFERVKVRGQLLDHHGALQDLNAAAALGRLIIRPAPVVAAALPWNQQIHDFTKQQQDLAVADIYLHRAIVLAILGDLKKAAEDLNEAGRLGLRTEELYSRRAGIRRILGNSRGAIEDEQRARDLRGANVLR
jgi:tetratricopeptide (TPR) repeat protein